MFAKLKKKIEVQNNLVGQNNTQQPRESSPAQLYNSSAPVHYPAHSVIHKKRTSQTKSPRTSMTEDDVVISQIQTEEEASSNFPQNDKISRTGGSTTGDCMDNKETSDMSDLLQEVEAELTEEAREHSRATNKQPANISSPHETTDRKLIYAENRIKILEGEIRTKNMLLNKIEAERLSPDNNEDLLTCQKKLASLENENRAMTIKFNAKCQELSEVQQQLSSAKSELETTQASLKESKEELKRSLRELEATVAEKGLQSSKLASALKSAEELKQKIEEMKKEREDLTERHAVATSELQTQLEVAEMDRRFLEVKIVDLEKKFEDDLKVTKEEARGELRKAMVEVEEQIKEKNKLLKKQEQKLGDLRKVVQRELSGKQAGVSNSNNCNNSNNNSSNSIDHRMLLDAEEAYFNNSSDVEAMATDFVAKINVSSNETSLSSYNNSGSRNYGSLDLSQDLNFRYLKHVILKFFLSREHEALQLIKVVSMLLRFDREEEKMIRDTLQWRTSWFRMKPQLPEKGQSAIVVPALY